MHRARKPAAARKRKSSSKEENESSKLSKLDFTSDEGFLPLSASDAGLSWYLLLSIQMVLVFYGLFWDWRMYKHIKAYTFLPVD